MDIADLKEILRILEAQDITEFELEQDGVKLRVCRSPTVPAPAAGRAVTTLVPARYFLVILRGIFLKGVGLVVLWRELLFLAAFAVLMLMASSAKFRKRLD